MIIAGSLVGCCCLFALVWHGYRVAFDNSDDDDDGPFRSDGEDQSNFVQAELMLERARQETARSQLAVAEAQARASTASSTAPAVRHLCPQNIRL